MLIENLKKMMPPSTVTKESNNEWIRVEKKIGVKFPQFYKDFIESYGTGSIGDFLWVINPHSANPNLNLEKISYFQESYEKMKKLFPEDYGRPKLPEQSSFVTWAFSDNGDSFFWVIDHNVSADNWNVGIHSSDQGEEEIFMMNTSKFIETMINNKLNSNILPIEFTSGRKYFI